MTVIVKFWPDKSQVPGTPFRASMWTVGLLALVSSFIAFPDELAGKMKLNQKCISQYLNLDSDNGIPTFPH